MSVAGRECPARQRRPESIVPGEPNMSNGESNIGRRNLSMVSCGDAALNAGLWRWYFSFYYYFTFQGKGSQGA